MNTPHDTGKSPERLNKFLARQLGISRREADVLIENETVMVNHTLATLGTRITPSDSIDVAGTPVVRRPAALRYIALNKPIGYVCSRRMQGNAPTIYSLLPPELHMLKPVGRLDKDSSGLLLLTNDGDFAYRMTHPKFAKTKQYRVRLDRDLEPLHQQMISDFGIELDDGRSRLHCYPVAPHELRELYAKRHTAREVANDTYIAQHFSTSQQTPNISTKKRAGAISAPAESILLI